MAKVYVGYETYGLEGIDDELVQFIFDVVISLTKLDSESEAGLILATDKRMRELNKKYRDKNALANILTFTYAESTPKEMRSAEDKNYLGDIFISRAELIREAKAQKVSYKERFVHLFAHGLLHLAGIHHPNEKAAMRMEKLEDKVIELVLSA